MGLRVEKNVEKISKEMRLIIAHRYHTITKAINKEFWGTDNESTHSFYVGSYGRGTATNTSDIDILVVLPEKEYEKYDSAKGNGQSRLLQAVKVAIQNSYPRTKISADGQVVILEFSDDVKFEVVPAFQKACSWSTEHIEYVYPDTNSGGNWKSTNPKEEQKAMDEKNTKSNGLLKDTCKHIRRIRDDNYSSCHLSGILIDSFVYDAIGNWRWIISKSDGKPSNPYDYEKSLLKYYRSNYFSKLYAPGSMQEVDKSDYAVLGKILSFMVGDK